MNMKSLRIASYNLQKCVGLDMQRRPDRSMLVIRALKADIVILQEADKRLPPRPSALPHDLIKARNFQVVDFEQPSGSLGWHGNAMLIRDPIRVQRTAKIKLPGLEPRGAILAELKTPIGSIRIIGVHLGLLRRYRLMQLSAITRAFRHLPAMPTVFAGDFNEWGSKLALDTAMQGFVFHDPGHSFPAARPIAALDSFAINSDFRVRNKGVFNRRPATVASDHLPVWIELGAA